METQSDLTVRMPDGEEDDCPTCGGAGFLDLERKLLCPNCLGSGKVAVYLPEVRAG
jgi:rubredoxin